jgi:hypothetical protein
VGVVGWGCRKGIPGQKQKKRQKAKFQAASEKKTDIVRQEMAFEWVWSLLLVKNLS